jgi:hypothetical protein
MLKLDDPLWAELKGGYKVNYNPVPALRKLEAGINVDEVWKELWNELHHQGDLGEASYAAIPHLVRIQKEKFNLGWNLYALASIIEIERHNTKNPGLPTWLKHDYRTSWKNLTQLAIRDLAQAKDQTTIQALLGCIALGKGLVQTGKIIVCFTEDELAEMLEEYRT